MPPPTLHLGHVYLLLVCEDTRGEWLFDPLACKVGYAAAIVLDWSFAGRLVTHGADAFTVVAHQPSRPSEWAALDRVPDQPLGTGALIRAVFGDPLEVMHRIEPALTELVELGALRRQQDRLLGLLPWRTRWPEADGTIERRLRAELDAHVAAPGDTPHVLDGLLSIFRGVGGLAAVLGEGVDRARVDPLTDRVPIGRDARELLVGLQLAQSQLIGTNLLDG